MERIPASEIGRTQLDASAQAGLELNQTFPSQPLVGDDRIRLLEIQPGKPDDPICAKIFTVRTSDSPAYEALSYTWGDQSQREQIQILYQSANGDQSVLTWVTTNCHAALKRLRKNITNPCNVWVDAICINQANISERNHQLTLMTRIYEGASCVIVYLGELADESDEAMDFIRDIDMASDYASEHRAKTSLREPDKAILEALFHRPWFSRIWVLQEVRMARKAVVYCGDRAVDWHSFRVFSRWNVSCKLLDKLPYVVATKPERNPFHKPAQRLLTELRDTRGCEATDPRDKLFAILSLILQSKFNNMAKNFEVIKMDYSLSPVQVFVNLAMYFLDTLGIGILGDVTGPSVLAGLPSWVPDWSMKPQSGRFRNDLYLGEEHWFTRIITGVKVKEARNIDGEPIYELYEKGSNLGSIVSIGNKCDLQNDSFPIAQWQNLQLGMKSSHHVYKDRGPPRRSFAALLDADSDVLEILEERVQIYGEGGEARESAIQEQALKARERGELPKVGIWSTLLNFCQAGFYATIFQQMQRVFNRCDSQRFFVTDTGLMGLGPEHIQIGDSVYFIKGVECPFVLRSGLEKSSRVAAPGEREGESTAPSRFRLVGGCSLGSIRSRHIDTSFKKIVIW